MNISESITEYSRNSAAVRIGKAIDVWLANNAERLRLRRQRADGRRLLSMTDSELADIGVSREEAWLEASRRFWEA